MEVYILNAVLDDLCKLLRVVLLLRFIVASEVEETVASNLRVF